VEFTRDGSVRVEIADRNATEQRGKFRGDLKRVADLMNLGYACNDPLSANRLHNALAKVVDAAIEASRELDQMRKSGESRS
jgi:hypothetical protein